LGRGRRGRSVRSGKTAALAVLVASLLALALGIWIMMERIYTPLKPFKSPEIFNIPGVPTEEPTEPGKFDIKLELPPSEPETFQPETANVSVTYDEQQAIEQQKAVGEPQPSIPPSTSGDVYHKVTISVNPAGAGTVYPAPGVYKVKEGSLTIQVMSVKSGYMFKRWKIICDNMVIDGGSAKFKTVQVVRDMVIEALFEAVKTSDEPIVTPPVEVPSGDVVVDLAFYDKITIAPTGTVTCLETGASKSLTPVEVAPNEWHGQCEFENLEAGKTYTFKYQLTNGLRLSGTFSITIKRSVEYYHQGFPYGSSASIALMSILQLEPRQVKELGGVLALVAAPMVVVSALSYVKRR
jgi:hypothetical protein